METDVWIPLINIEDDRKIWVGTKVRLYNVGLNVKDKSLDYYDYLVSNIYDNNDYLQLTNLSKGEAGNIICVIKKDSLHHYALGKSLKEMMESENTYVLLE
ncbi:hypothetical protein SAMN05661091_2930 [Paenibacillus uliginis N3/975]|uniref:Uncharacterized protein n=1 Tax=Paenibacillus uliginis N3/975 TaxID=1313296 RepID=A0A1X7HEV2_9BACL|nr:hypothetical protein [Paenibacillus uliginis]SMF85219.1 hypothetical protein SAMN05661091_2930 [Paenibacillus uliginis N3/975]